MNKVVKSILRPRLLPLKCFRISLLLLWVLIGLDSQMLAQKGRGDEPLPDELHELLTKRTKAIEKELDSVQGNEWPGVYFDGDHHPTVLTWAPKNGFIVTASHHTFAPTWVNYGKVTSEARRLGLHPELQKGQPNAFGIGPEFLQVRWDKWHFLVPSDSLLQFAYAVHSSSGSQLGGYFIKAGDRGRPRKGLPDLPPEYVKFMKMPAIRARIVAVKGDPEDVWNSEVILDAGSRQNVIEGMEFYFLGKSGLNVGLRVTKVENARSYARLSSIGLSGEDSANEAVLKIGRSFSSKMPKNFIEPG